MKKTNDPKIFLKTFALTTGTLAFAFLCNLAFIIRAYERAPYDEIVRVQLANKAFYGSALNANDLGYKLALARKTQPDLLVLGSSRTMQFRHQAFVSSFVNCGGVFKNIDEGSIFVERLLKHHRPKVVLFGVDYWWFNKGLGREPDRHNLDETQISAQKLLLPFQWLLQRKLKLQQYVSVLKDGALAQRSEYTRATNLGIHALKNSSGFRPDGSYFSAESAFETDRLKDMRAELKTIVDGTNDRAKMGIGKFVDAAAFAKFSKLVSALENVGAHVVLFLPPVSPMFLAETKDKRSFLQDLVPRLKSLETKFVEFHDVTDLRPVTKDSEFFDGWHGGDVVYLRVLREILKRNPNSALTSTVRKTALDSWIDRYQGQGLVIFDEEKDLFLH